MGRISFILPILIVTLLSAGYFSCLHDTSISLENDTPRPSRHIVTDTLFYPDSVVCTLVVHDRNDSILSHRLCFRDRTLKSGDSSLADTMSCISSFDTGSLTILPLEQSLKRKRFLFLAKGTQLGYNEGIASFIDEQDGQAELPFAVHRMLFIPFDTYPLNIQQWKPYAASDSMRMGYEWIDRKLRFEFDTDSIACSDDKVGIMSAFQVCGNFDVSLDFKLRDDLYDGFSFGFFVSADTDTSRWAQNRAGISIIGSQEQRLRIQAQSINFQIASVELPFYSGRLQIVRREHAVVFRCYDADPYAAPIIFDENFTFDVADSCYVHLWMRVDNFQRVRHCSIDNFKCENGWLAFE